MTRKIVLGSAMLCLLTAVSFPSIAQTPFDVQSELARRGLSDQDVQNAKLAQVNPYFQFFKQWMSCVQGISRMSDGSPAELTKMTTSMCASQEQELRAQLGAKLGLQKADRALAVVELSLRSQFEDQAKQLSAAVNVQWAAKMAQDAQTFKTQGDWKVMRASGGDCVAIHYDNFSMKTVDMAVARVAGTTTVKLVFHDSDERAALKQLKGRPLQLHIETRTDGEGQKFYDLTSSIANDDGTDDIDLIGDRAIPKEWAFANEMDVMTIDGVRGGPLTSHGYQITHLKNAIAAMRDCVPMG